MPIFVTTDIEDADIIDTIADRIMQDPAQSPYKNKMSAVIDLILTHCNGTPHSPSTPAAADSETFWHDIHGIARNLIAPPENSLLALAPVTPCTDP